MTGNDGCSIHAASLFQPSQIVGLEHDAGCLYAEVVQIIESRQSCWVRPLVLTLKTEVATQPYNVMPPPALEWYDLRQDSDLLLPLTLFRVALDVEVLPWLAYLYADDATIDSRNAIKGHQLFRAFIQQVWQAHPEVFQAASRLKKT